MISGLSPSTQAFLAQIRRLGEQAATAQREIGSGVRIGRPSDAPDQIPVLLELRASVAQSVQVQANLERVKAQVDAGESGLESAVALLDRAVQIARKANPQQPPTGSGRSWRQKRRESWSAFAQSPEQPPEAYPFSAARARARSPMATGCDSRPPGPPRMCSAAHWPR